MHRIALLTGGSTPERDVALAGAAQVVKALRTLGHEVTVVDTVSGPLTLAAEEALLAQDVRREPPTPERLAELAAQENLPALVSSGEMRAADLVFLVLHGLQGEGGTVQALLELGRLRYTGSGPLGSGMAMDKEVTKRQLEAAGIPTADWGMWPMLPGAIADLGMPLIVKPSNGGSTVGLTLVKAPEELDDAVALALATDRDVMLERFLPGREFTVGILGQQALAVGEIIPAARDLRLRVQVHPRPDARGLPGRDPRRAGARDARSGARHPPGPEAARLLARRFPPGFGGRPLRPRSQHPPRHDRHQPPAAERRRRRHPLPRPLRRNLPPRPRPLRRPVATLEGGLR